MVAEIINNPPRLKTFIRKKSPLFWWIKKEEIENVHPRFLVEAILNYGDEMDVKELFSLLGIEQVAKIFHQQISRSRNNYAKPIRHFFHLYFLRHVPEYPQ